MRDTRYENLEVLSDVAEEQPIGPSLKWAVKDADTWKQRGKNLWHWAIHPAHRSRLWDKFANIKYPLILKQIAQFIVSMVALAAVVTEFFVIAPIVVAGGVGMLIYMGLSNGILDVIYNLASGGIYKNEKDDESLLWGDRIPLLGLSMVLALKQWPKSLAGKVFQFFTVKPIQLVMTPILLAVALTQELLVAASIGIAAALVAIPPAITFTVYFVVNVPRMLFNGLLKLCCCSKSRRRNEEPLRFDGEELGQGPSDRYGSSASESMSRAPVGSRYKAPVADADENPNSHAWCGLRRRRADAPVLVEDYSPEENRAYN